MAAGSGWRQLKLLLWKDYLIRKRKPITLFGVIWAVLVVGSLWVVRINVNNQYNPTCAFPARALPSAGMLTFLQSFICSINNECSPLDKFEEIPTYEKSRFAQLCRQFGPLLYNETVIDVASTVPDALKLVATVARAVDDQTFLHIAKNGLKVKDLFTYAKRTKRRLENMLSLDQSTVDNLLEAEISIPGILSGGIRRCDVKSITQVLRFKDGTAPQELVEKLCSLSKRELLNMAFDLMPDINLEKYVIMVGNIVFQLNGDDRILSLGDALQSALRVTTLRYYVPPELIAVMGYTNYSEDKFTYFNVTIINQLIDLFEPTFGGTDSYKSIREVTGALVSGYQWLSKLFDKDNDSTALEDATELVLNNVGKKGMNDLGEVDEKFGRALDLFETRMRSDAGIGEIFDVLTKLTNFVLKWLPKQTQHDILLYSTLLTKLIEGARKVVVDNIRMEELVYNVSMRNPEAVKAIVQLPPDIIASMFDALTDAERIQILTSKLNNPGPVFCDVIKLQNFLKTSKDVATEVKSHLCTDAWKNYLTDLIMAFGIFEVRSNINMMASILIQETLGKDTSDQLYTIDQDFKAFRAFVRDLMVVTSETRPKVDWNKLLNLTNDDEVMKVIMKKRELGKQILVTVHGAFAHQVVKQNTILEIKITPILVDATTIFTGLNQELESVPRDLVQDFKSNYGDILQTVLLTLSDEDKTLRSLSTNAVQIFCNGVENATQYLIYPKHVRKDILTSILCASAQQIERSLSANSTIGKAINNVLGVKRDSSADVNWTKLINNMKNLYKALEQDFPYLLEFTSYGVNETEKVLVEQMLEENKEFWFSSKNISRTAHLSFKFCFQLLDLLDRDIFNMTNVVWLKLKYVVDSANGFVQITDQVLKLFNGLLNKEGSVESELPASTVLALKAVVPNIPYLMMDATDLILEDETDITSITSLMNSDPPWPCSMASISEYLNISSQSTTAVKGLEAILCMNDSFQQEWLNYIEEQKIRTNMSIEKANETKYDAHIFLKFSAHFDEFVRDVAQFKSVLVAILSENATDVTVQNDLSIVLAYKYASDAFGDGRNQNQLRSFLHKVDEVLNSLNSSSIEVSPLHALWQSYSKCSNGSVLSKECRVINRLTWKNMIKFCSVVIKEVSGDLLTYFVEINEPNSNMFQLLGFTKKTALYVLYEKLQNFAGVLLNSYWDFGFMNQIRRASKSEFWDCEAVVDALVVPPGYAVTPEDVRRVKPYVCPSLLYWISLPRGENILMDVIAKPQYFFYNMPSENLTSGFETAYDNIINLTEETNNVQVKNLTNITDTEPNTIEKKFEEIIDNIIAFKLTNEDASYRLFNEVNKKQFISTVYLTRITEITSKIFTIIDDLKIVDIKIEGSNINDTKKLEADLNAIKRIFKRRPSEAIAIHFDVLTDMLWKNDENFNLVNALDKMCIDFKNNSTKDLLNDDRGKVKNQICSKDYKVIFNNINNLDEVFKLAKVSLFNLVNSLQNTNDVSNIDVINVLMERTELIKYFKLSIRYADDLGLPIYLKYLQSNLRHYGLVLSFLAGEDWWVDLRTLYNGPNAMIFFDLLEHSLEITENILTHLDKIHLVRLLRDINVNDTRSFCLDNLTLADYIPDGTGYLSKLKTQMCHENRTDLFRELPQLVFASQGYDNNLKLSKDLNYTSLEQDIETIESKLLLIRDGPHSAQRPSWVTDEKLQKLKMAAVGLFSKETITKVAFGVLSNVLDGSILFLNNSHCSLCSSFTSWVKQLNLQLYKKLEYDNLLCHLNDMTMMEIYNSLKNDFHWDMAIKELISFRNYTRLELNKSLNELLEQMKLHILDDISSNSTKLTNCLTHNVTRNGFGNASLFLSVVSKSLHLIRSALPHLKEVDGISQVDSIKQLATQVTPRMIIKRQFKEVLREVENATRELQKAVDNDSFVQELLTSDVNLYMLKTHPNNSIETWLYLREGNWRNKCQIYNCSLVGQIVSARVDKTWIDDKLQNLQDQEFWTFDFISNILVHIEAFFSHSSRIFGVVSKIDVEGILEGKLTAVLDFLLQIIQKNTMDSLLYSVQSLLDELQPLLKDTSLNHDLQALTLGLRAISQFRDDFISNVDLRVNIAELFSNAEELELGFTSLGINNTNFWSIAAPRIHSGSINLKPLLTSKQSEIHISSFLCQMENMSSVISPANVDVVTAEDVYGAVIEQFCGLSDERAKQILPVLFDNLNFTYIVHKVLDMALTKVYTASNLTNQEGGDVLSKYSAILSLLPTVQNNMGNLTEVLANEPLFKSFKNFDSLNGLLSSSEFLSSAGNMLCGKPFVANGNRFYNAIAKTHDYSNEPDAKQLEVLPTDFCRDLYKDIISMSGGKIIWSFVKPLIMGRILFTPPTPVVMNIIEKANTSFSQMSRLTNILHKFARSFSSVEILSEHRDGLSALRHIMTSGLFAQLQSSFLPRDEASPSFPDVNIDGLFDDFGDLKSIGKILMKASDLLGCINLNRFRSTLDEDALAKEAVKLTRVNEFSAGLVFTKVEQYESKPINVEYKIRMDIDSVPTTTRKRNQFWTPGPEGNFLEEMRYFRGFVQIQDLINKAIIESSYTGSRDKRATEAKDDPKWALYTQQIPYPCYTRDYFQSSLYESQALIVAFFFAFIMTVSSAVRFIVSEKESGNTMLMSIMGVRLSTHTFSWFVASCVETAAAACGMLLVLRAGGVLPHSHLGLLALLVLNYGLSVVMFCYLLSKLFSSGSVGAVSSGLILLMTFMPYVIILALEANLSYLQKIITSLSMSTSFCYSLLMVGRAEAMGSGAQWSMLWTSPETDGNSPSLGVTVLMTLFDSLLYLVIGCIIDRFFGIKRLSSNITHSLCPDEKGGVSIVHVSKRYEGRRGGKDAGRLALDDVSLELHRGQITTLLGQNGAGKTTLIKIITGMVRATSGHVTVRSEPLVNGRTRIGLCPQQDVLFENMTAVEHITLYAQLKSGLPYHAVKEEIESMAALLSLGAAQTALARRLSGGMRRRLGVALAFLARPHLVLLDEPSSGVDPRARRDIWSLIMKLKEDRTVLLTTHHLDEAELLSDQIVIMHKGQIHTIGSPVEIKRSLGNGYKMTVTYQEKSPKSMQDLDQVSPWDDVEEDDAVTMEERAKKVLAVVRDVVKNAQIVDMCGTAVEILMPFFDANGLNNNFLEVCSKVEDSRETLAYSTMSMECSSLEQVMYNVTHNLSPNYEQPLPDDVPSKSGSSSSVRDDTTPLVNVEGKLSGTSCEHYWALLHKRWTHYSRNRWLLFFLVILPSLFVAISMGFSLIRPPYDNEIALKLDPDLYEPSTHFAIPAKVTSDNKNEELAASIMDAIINTYSPASNWSSADNPKCKCGEWKQECDYSSYNRTAPKLLLAPNVSTLNDWLLSSQEFYIEKRYTGWSSRVAEGDTTRVVAWYNNKGHHALPAAVAAAASALLRQRSSPRSGIAVYSHPLKISHEQLSKSTILQHVADVGVAGLLLLAFSLIPAGAAIYLVKERTSQQKRLQLLCGVSPNIYWMAALTWDMLIIIINVAITACVLLLFNLPVFVEKDNLPAICILLVLFGFACNSLTHLCEKLFRESSMANMVLFCANVFVGNSCLAILLILDVISESDMTDNARWVLHKVFMLSPQFALADALVEIAKNTVQAQVLSRFGMDTYKSPLRTSLVSHQILALILVGAFLMIVNLLHENYCFVGFFERWRKTEIEEDKEDEMEDLDVTAERRRVETSMSYPLTIRTIGNINAGYMDTEGSTTAKKGSARRAKGFVNSDAAQCVALRKQYGSRVAVRALSLGVPRGQCTALLGENGAGKSSTFGMLCGELRPTSGHIVLNQTVVTSQRDLCTGFISYCPQSDAIDPLMTVRQTLRFYCRLRGLQDHNEVIKRTLSMFELNKYAQVLNGNLSGGNKRKLCTAIAFMSRSSLILLDEPTSGMDPGGRACVSRGLRGAGPWRGALLATHALAEARREARRAALLRQGRLAALADLHGADYLHRFGGGYVVAARTGHASAACAAWAALRARAPAVLRALHCNSLQALLPATATVNGKEVTTKLSSIFRLMAELQSECDIEDFTINQSSLEQMFLDFSDKADLVDFEPLPEVSDLYHQENVTSL